MSNKSETFFYVQIFSKEFLYLRTIHLTKIEVTMVWEGGLSAEVLSHPGKIHKGFK